MSVRRVFDDRYNPQPKKKFSREKYTLAESEPDSEAVQREQRRKAAAKDAAEWLAFNKGVDERSARIEREKIERNRLLAIREEKARQLLAEEEVRKRERAVQSVITAEVMASIPDATPREVLLLREQLKDHVLADSGWFWQQRLQDLRRTQAEMLGESNVKHQK